MPADTDIGNMALSRLGTRATIADLSENSTEARQVNLWYATVRDDLLGMLDWTFNRVTQPLASSGTPPDRWAYELRLSVGLPEDAGASTSAAGAGPAGTAWPCPSRSRPTAPTRSFVQRGLANAVFGQRVTDPTRFTPAFVLAFVDCLAAAIALADHPEGRPRRAAGRPGTGQRSSRRWPTAPTSSPPTERFQVAKSLAVRGYEDGPLAYLSGAWR